MFGLKVKKKKKKVSTDLVLANKGALGKAWKINTPTHKLTILVSCTLCTIESFSLSYCSPCQTVIWLTLVCIMREVVSDTDWWPSQASAHVSRNWLTYICFYVESEVAGPSEASPLLDEETPEDQPGISAVTTRVIPNNKRCKKKSQCMLCTVLVVI